MAAQPNRAIRSNPSPLPYAIHLLPGEKLVQVIRGSRILLSGGLLLRGIIGLLLLAAVMAFSRPDSREIEIIAIVLIVAVLFGSVLARYLPYRYNICILTDRRIISIERSHLLIQENRVETEYDTIREVNVQIMNLFERLLHIGTVRIETLTSSPDICLNSVDDPFKIQESIYSLRDQFVR